MLEKLKVILDIQELDMKMIRLMRLKKERQQELDHIHSVKADIVQQLGEKEGDVKQIKKDIMLLEVEEKELVAKVKEAEKKQSLKCQKNVRNVKAQ